VPDLQPIQPFVFLTPGENNTKEACSSSLDLSHWKLAEKQNFPRFSNGPIKEFKAHK
jgi:hypothetical protein